MVEHDNPCFHYLTFNACAVHINGKWYVQEDWLDRGIDIDSEEEYGSILYDLSELKEFYVCGFVDNDKEWSKLLENYPNTWSHFKVEHQYQKEAYNFYNGMIEKAKMEELKQKIFEKLIANGVMTSKADVMGYDPLEDKVYTKRITIDKSYEDGLQVMYACVTSNKPDFSDVTERDVRINTVNHRKEWVNIFIGEAPEDMVKMISEII